MGQGEHGATTAVVDDRAATTPDHVALLAPGREPMTYRELREHVRTIAGQLRQRGIEGTDRVALVVDNGAEAASAFLAVSAAASCAPLNPAYRADELAFYFEDLRARAVIVGADTRSPVRDVAARHDVTVLELVPHPDAPAGSFHLDGDAGVAALDPPTRDDEALVLHTSGTTARPKLVPLTHGRLTLAARTIAATLELDADDRCLNVMPLFHIHGLVASLLATLSAGGSVACTPGFDRRRVGDWLDGLAPTWITAVPTMYQALLERSAAEPDAIPRHRLRFARSSSAALPVAVLEGVEQLLGVPVIEAYGMTEASHQMTSNPLPPAARKPGSVGVPTGLELAVLNDDWQPVPAGDVGEVAIRGERVFAGYEANAEANAASFRDGWFRTGDQGRLDDDGYLFLTGRIKELINRGGEKISPLEVDGVLLRHPGVAEAVTFALPDPRLGEEVAAAVVPRDGAPLSEDELQDFVAQTIAPHKVPRRIVVVDAIPKGATGKVQRASLPRELAIPERTPAADPVQHPGLERRLRELWAEVLEVPEVDPLDDFFALGGDSILGTEAVARIREALHVELPLVAIVRAPTPRAMTAEVQRAFGWDHEGIVLIQEGDGDGRPPLHYIHGADGEIVGMAAVARRLGPERPVYGLRPPGEAAPEKLPPDVPRLADVYLHEIRRVQPAGPYHVVGFCMGAAVALELAHRLEADGDEARLLLIDPRIRRPSGLRFTLWLAARRASQGRLVGAVLGRLRRARGGSSAPPRADVTGALERMRDAYDCRPTAATTALVRSAGHAAFDLPRWYLRQVWRNVVADESVARPHQRLFRPPAVDDLTDAVRRALAAVERGDGP